MSALLDFLTNTKPGILCMSIWIAFFAVYGSASMSVALSETGRWGRGIYSLVLIGLAVLPLMLL